jgi:glutathione S-transferase
MKDLTAAGKMKLVSYPTSPFARKVRIAAIEVGVNDRLEIVDANPLADDGVLPRHPSQWPEASSGR